MPCLQIGTASGPILGDAEASALMKQGILAVRNDRFAPCTAGSF